MTTASRQEADPPREERRDEAAEQRPDRGRDRRGRADQRVDPLLGGALEVAVDERLHRGQQQRGAEAADDRPEDDDRRTGSGRAPSRARRRRSRAGPMTYASLRPIRSPILLPIRMNAAETSASSAIADWTPLTVVPRSRTTAEIDTFIKRGVHDQDEHGHRQADRQPVVGARGSRRGAHRCCPPACPASATRPRCRGPPGSARYSSSAGRPVPSASRWKVMSALTPAVTSLRTRRGTDLPRYEGAGWVAITRAGVDRTCSMPPVRRPARPASCASPT